MDSGSAAIFLYTDPLEYGRTRLVQRRNPEAQYRDHRDVRLSRCHARRDDAEKERERSLGRIS